MWPRLSKIHPRKHPRSAKASLPSSHAGRSNAADDEIQQARCDIMLACLEAVATPGISCCRPGKPQHAEYHRTTRGLPRARCCSQRPETSRSR